MPLIIRRCQVSPSLDCHKPMSALAHGAERPVVHRFGGPRGDRNDGIDRRDYLFFLAAFPKTDPISAARALFPAAGGLTHAFAQMIRPPEQPGPVNAPARDLWPREIRLAHRPDRRFALSAVPSRSMGRNRARSGRESDFHSRYACSSRGIALIPRNLQD